MLSFVAIVTHVIGAPPVVTMVYSPLQVLIPQALFNLGALAQQQNGVCCHVFIGQYRGFTLG